MNALGRWCLWFYMFLCNFKGQCVWLESPSWPERCWRSTAISGVNRYAFSPSSSSTSLLAALFFSTPGSPAILPPLAPLEAAVTHLYPKVGAAQVVGALPLMVWCSWGGCLRKHREPPGDLDHHGWRKIEHRMHRSGPEEESIIPAVGAMGPKEEPPKRWMMGEVGTFPSLWHQKCNICFNFWNRQTILTSSSGR